MLKCPKMNSCNDNSDDNISNLADRLNRTLRVNSNPGEQLRSRVSKSQPLVNRAVDSVSPSPALLVNPARFRTTESIDDYKYAVFLFADIIDSCNLGQKMSGRAFVELTDPVFTGFQDIVQRYGTLYGISVVKINGDCIMLAAASHDFEQTQNQVEMIIYISQLFSNFMVSHNEQKKAHKELYQFDFRFGIDIGEATKTRVRIREQTDWSGNAANRASRMESTSHPNQVQVTDAVYDIGKKHFEFSTPSMRPIKGYGEVSTRFLLQPKIAFLEKQNINVENKLLQKSSSSSTEFPRKMIGNNRSSSANH